MGTVHHCEPVLLIVAAFSRHDDSLTWAKRRAEREWGPIALASERFDFGETRYYEATMGTGIRKEFWAFEPLVDPARLAQFKCLSNSWEEEYRHGCSHPDSRPLNLDPGYLTEAKLVLATTKDRDHRIYLSQGIFAEVTLFHHRGLWESRPWTYPDYRRGDYHQFFTRCREYLRQRYGRGTSRGSSGKS